MFLVRFARWISRQKIVAVAIAMMTVGVIGMTVETAGAATPGAEFNTSKACEQFWDTSAAKLQAFDSYSISVNGKAIPKDKWNVSDYVTPGDKVSVTFKLKAACANTYVAISMYQAPADHFVPSQAGQQKLVQRVGGAYKADKSYTLTATTPNCYFQMDINTGWEYKPGDYTLDHRGRLVMAANGGTKKCVAPATTTTKKPTTTTSTTKKPTTTSTSTTTSTTSTTVPVKPQETTTTRKPTTTSTSTTTSTTTEVKKNEASATLQEVCVVEDKTKSGYLATLKNTGNTKEDFTIAKNGTEIANSPITVPAGQTTHVLVPFQEDETAAVSITAEQADFSLSKQLTLDCLPETKPVAAPVTTTTSTTEKPAEVKDTTVNKPELAHTGFSVFAWLTVGGLLLLIGFGLVQMARTARA